nr:hypothetical protein [Tanacetum cinerariifolium]
MPHIPPPLGANTGNVSSPNRVDTMPTENTNNATTTNVAQNKSDSDVEEDTRSSSEFLTDLNAEFHDRALLSSQKRFYKRSGR